jgi:hypothetical protein
LTVTVRIGTDHDGLKLSPALTWGFRAWESTDATATAHRRKKKLSRLDWGILGAAAEAFIALFLPRYGVSSGLFSASVSG